MALSAAVGVGMNLDRSIQVNRDNQLQPGYELPLPIDQTDRSDVLSVIRQLFSDGQPRTPATVATEQLNLVHLLGIHLQWGAVPQPARSVRHGLARLIDTGTGFSAIRA
jgi:hypothetical protein